MANCLEDSQLNQLTKGSRECHVLEDQEMELLVKHGLKMLNTTYNHTADCKVHCSCSCLLHADRSRAAEHCCRWAFRPPPVV